MEEKDIVTSLMALAQAMRLRIFRVLVVAGRDGLTPGSMADQLGLPASTLSFHLKELTHAGLVNQERDGRNLIYRAQYEHMAGVIAYLTEHCCQGQPCLPTNKVTACKPSSKSKFELHKP